jgi:hypothetical protein
MVFHKYPMLLHIRRWGQPPQPNYLSRQTYVSASDRVGSSADVAMIGMLSMNRLNFDRITRPGVGNVYGVVYSPEISVWSIRTIR